MLIGETDEKNSGGNKMKTSRCIYLFLIVINIILIRVGLTNAGINIEFTKNITEQDLSDDLKSNDIEKRMNAISSLNHRLENNILEMSESIKKICYRLIQEELSGKSKLDRRKDDERLYEWGVIKLATKINNKEVLPYLIENITDKLAKPAILKQGEAALEEIFKVTERDQKLSGWKKKAIIEIFTEMTRPKEKGYVAKGSYREKMKQFVLRILEESQYTTANEKSKIVTTRVMRYNKNNRKITYMKKYILDYLLVLGDEDIMPILRDMAKNDAYYEEVSESYLPYAKMSGKEREDFNRKNKGKIEAAAQIPSKKVKYYPIREKAQKILEKLEN